MDKWVAHTQDYVANLLDRGVRVLIYAGTYDWQCNWVANKLWVDKLEWSGRAEYAAQEWRDWSVDGKKAGEVKVASLLTFATIREAGHMISHLFLDYEDSHLSLRLLTSIFSLFFPIHHVPHDKPLESVAMISRWLAQENI